MPDALPKIELAVSQVALFGYGSLISKASLELTLGHPYAGPLLPCEVRGWRRRWNAFTPNTLRFYAVTEAGRLYPDRIVYLNVQRDAGASINGMLFVVTAEELAALDKREWIYSCVSVQGALQGACVVGGDVQIYAGLDQYLLHDAGMIAEAGLRKSYCATVDRGLMALGPEFRTQFENTTDPLPRHLLFDDERE